MKPKLVKLESIPPSEAVYIIGGNTEPVKDKKDDKKKKRKQKRALRKAQSKFNSDCTDTIKNDTFKL